MLIVRRPGLDHLLEDAAEEIHLRAPGILRRELHVVAVAARQLDRLDRLLDHLLGLHAQLALHVDRRGGDEGVDAALGRVLQGIAGAADIAVVGARQAADDAVPDRVGDRLDRLEVAVAGGREAGLDHIHAQALQLPGDAHLFVARHGRPGALLAVSEGGVKYDQTVFHGRSPCLPVACRGPPGAARRGRNDTESGPCGSAGYCQYVGEG